MDGRAKPGHDAVGTTAPLVPYFNAHTARAGHPRLAVLMSAKGVDGGPAAAMTVRQRPCVSTYLRFAVALSSGIYIIVRSLDNLEKGLSPPAKAAWNKVFITAGVSSPQAPPR
jgi:hypothetical protein